MDLSTLKTSIETKINQVNQGFQSGVFPLVSSLLINLTLLILFLLLFFGVPQTSHIILGDFSKTDPATTSFLILLYTTLTCYINTDKIFFYIKQYNDQKNGVNYIRLRSLVNINVLVSWLPICFWLIFLLFNTKANLQNLGNITSFLIIGLGIYFLWSLYNIFSIRKIYQFDTPDSDFIIRGPVPLEIKDRLKELMLRLMLTLLFILIYNFLTYETNVLDVFKNAWGAYNEKTGFNLIRTIFSVLTLIVGFIYIRLVTTQNKGNGWKHWTAMCIALICMLFIGSIKTLDILLIYFCTIRSLLYLAGLPFRFVSKYFNFLNAGTLKQKLLKYAFSIGLSILLVIWIFNSPSQERLLHKIIPDITLGSPAKDRTINCEFKYWMQNRPAGSDIYLVAGQGGGSRAGAAFFNIMTRLDPCIGSSIFCMATISGSSNGAGFYLGLKHAGNLPTEADILKVTETLYQRDYISESLFKLLFTDWWRVWNRSVWSDWLGKSSRNASIMKEEQLALKLVLDKSKPNYLDSTVYSLYKNENTRYPVFLPVSYNVSRGMRANMGVTPFSFNDSLKSFPLLKNDSIYDIKLTEAINTSQAFPFISASSTINAESYLDGGVYDNLALKTVHEIYRDIKPLRDSLYSGSRIVVLTIENGKFEIDTSKTKYSDFMAVVSAVSNSIFTSGVLDNLEAIKDEMNTQTIQDTIIRIKVFKEQVNKNKKKPFWNFLKLESEEGQVTMSRFLSQNDINTINNLSETRCTDFFRFSKCSQD